MGEDIVLYKANGEVIPLQSRANVTRITQGTQTRAVNADDTVVLTIQSPEPQQYDIGDMITVFGRDYFLNRLPKVTRNGANAFTYDLEFEGVAYDLMRVTYDLTIDTTSNELQDVSGDSLTGDLKRFMTVLVANANRVFPNKWKLGECPEDTQGDKTLTFSEDDNCLTALQTLCNEDNFNVEFDIVKDNDGTYRIDIYEEVGGLLPYSFRYGRGLGLYELSRDNVSSANLVTRLKVYGSTENIASKYVKADGTTAQYYSDRLLLPGITKKGDSYIEHEDAVNLYGIFEARKNFDDIKPTYTGVISSIDAESVLIFSDDNFPFDLNATDSEGSTLYLVSGLEAKIHFNTGNLAGYEFCINSYDHTTKTFKLCKLTDDRGEVFPSETYEAFRFKVGDEYKILDIALPEEYIDEASERLLEAGEEYYTQNSQPKVQYSLSVTKRWLEELVGVSGDADEPIYNVFAPGDRIQVYDEEIGVDKNIRIKSFTRNVLDYYDYKLTISDTQTQGSIITRIISDLIEIDKSLTINNLKDPVRARMAWRNAQELYDMVFDPEGNYYSDKIAPNSIDTLMLSVGAKSMQFMLQGVKFEPNYQGDPNKVNISSGTLTHLTIEEDIRTWELASQTVVDLQSDTAYYIYAVCNRATGDNAGWWRILNRAVTVEEEAGLYQFWVGVLHSVDSGTNVRAISLTYGFTTINGRYITTGRIQSSDGTTWFDLDDSEIHGKITFTASDGTSKTVSSIDDYLSSTLSKILYDIADEIDGEIDTWFTTTDPRSSGSLIAIWGSDHIGDIWYNPDTDKLYYFEQYEETSSSGAITIGYRWREVDDEDAKATFRSMYANSYDKRRIFLTQPTTPYDVGDLWIKDDGYIYVCLKARKSTENYNASDWSSDAIAYDNTKTVIEGGLITTGTIQLADDSEAICAGITGLGNDDTSLTTSPVRIWAGSTFKNRATAPFRVLNDGTLYATNAHIEGHVEASSGNIGGFSISEDEDLSLVATAARIRFWSDESLGYGSYLSAGQIYFNNAYITFNAGLNVAGSYTNYRAVQDIAIDGSKSGLTLSRVSGIEISAKGYSSSSYSVDSDASYGNHALYLSEGNVCGLRLRTRRVYSSTTLSVMDSVILVAAHITLTLPASPEDGQVYFIRRILDSVFTVDGNGHTLMRTNIDDATGTSTISFGGDYMNVFIYDATNGYWWHNYLPNYS